jgi:hypothetical protein
MAARLMNVLRSALHRRWQQCYDALHPEPHPTLLEALRDTYLATAHTVTQFTQDAERMEYPQFRARLLRMAAEDQGHVTWLRDALLARGGALPTCACPPTVAPTSWAALLREVAAERRASEALLEPMQLAEQADPEMAEGFRRLRAAKQQHREVLLDMLVKSDPYALARSPAAGRPADAPAAFERAHALSPPGSARRGTCPKGHVQQDPRMSQGIVSYGQGVVCMSRQIFVWRMAQGPRAGDPGENTPGNLYASRVHREISHPEQGPIDYTGAFDYVFDELSHNRLRRGWGVANPDLDLQLPEQIWIEHYRMACQKYWSSDPETSHAVGSRQVLCCLLEMSVGDVIFVPKSPNDRHFIVTTVKRPYAFDHATVVEEADVRNDFRHVIGVEDTMRYAYGAGTLYPGLFEAPLREAIQRISEDDHSYRTLEDFLRSWGR